MIPMNPMQILQAVRNGANPSQSAMQLARSSPAVQQAMQIMTGKTPDQVRDMAYQIARQRGVDLNQIAQQWGIRLPK